MAVELAYSAAGAVAAAVRTGLSGPRKALPSWLLYDAAGSALFEEITALPEYYLTRAEQAILEAHAAEVVAAAGRDLTLIELGAGTATKTRTLLQALLAAQRRVHYVPVDVSPTALAAAGDAIRRTLPRVQLEPIVADYSDGLRAWRAPAGRKLVLFLGSSIGNYEPAAAGALLRRIRQGLMRPGDALLLGADRPKDPPTLLRAYDDRRGVTARFNRNLLWRINRELGGRFEPESFAHRAVWDPRRSRIEMHLESSRAQRVPITGLGLEFGFAAGERVHTENSYKLTPRQLERIRRAAGLAHERTFTDPEGRFALHLLRARGSNQR